MLRACACCIEIHKKLTNFNPGVEGVSLSLHIGVGAGNVRVLQVGGEVPPDTKIPRYEYVICGSPLDQVAIAEPLAAIGETVISPQAWQYVDQFVGLVCFTAFAAFYALNYDLMACRAHSSVRVMRSVLGSDL